MAMVKEDILTLFLILRKKYSFFTFKNDICYMPPQGSLHIHIFIKRSYCPLPCNLSFLNVGEKSG